MNPDGAVVSAGAGRIMWLRSIAWLLFLGPFFFLSYGFANGLAAERGITASIFFEWERHIPFVPWTIVPYWSIDLLYGLSFLFCRGADAVDRHGLRLLSVQIVSVACFVLFPLRFAFERPPSDGLFGALFDALASFDQPFNQAPSLHIGLLLVIWARFALGTRGYWRCVVHAWAVLIGVSVLTTFQHHFIDVPTGVLVGLLCMWIWPDRGASPLSGWRRMRVGSRCRLALCYLGGAGVLAAVAFGLGGVGLWLSWAAVALLLVAVIYLGPGGRGFQKHDGRHSAAIAILLWPYIACAWLNSRAWTLRRPLPDPVCDGVWLGRLPGAAEMRRGGFGALCDLSAELPAPSGEWRYAGLAWLDLVAPDADRLRQAAHAIERLRASGPVLVCCALGYSRSASAVAAWLLLSGRAQDAGDAIAMVRAARPGVVLGPAHRAALAACADPAAMAVTAKSARHD